MANMSKEIARRYEKDIHSIDAACSGDGFRGILVAYLSATGTTARTAEKLANVTGMN